MEKKITIRNTNESEEARKGICLEQLAQDRQKLLVKWPFIGGVIMRMELIPVRDDRLGTACTDGDNIFVDINFYSKLNQDERLFVLAHEVWHSVLLHFARCKSRDREQFNYAADLEIHFTLANEGMKEPFVLPHDLAWSNLSAEEIYERLPGFLKNRAKGRIPLLPGQVPPEKASNSFGPGLGGFDRHIYKGDQPSEMPQDDTKGDDDAHGQKSDLNKSGENPRRGEQEGKPDASSEFVIDKDYAPVVSANSVERSRSRSIASAQQVERTQGKLPSGIQRLLDKLLKPSIPWQEMLKQFVTACYGGKRRWLPPARRHVWQDIYLPSMRDEVLKAVVALDTSGSTMRDLPIFFAELVSLMNSFGRFELDVIQCDAEIQDVAHYSNANPPPPDRKWKAKGFGGTDFRPVFDYVRKEMREQPDLLLFFTDGYGDAPEQRPAYPVMWVLTNDGKGPAEWGRVTHFKKGE